MFGAFVVFKCVFVFVWRFSVCVDFLCFGGFIGILNARKLLRIVRYLGICLLLFVLKSIWTHLAKMGRRWYKLVPVLLGKP